MHESAVAHRRANGIEVLIGSARFVEPKVVEIVDGERLTAKNLVVTVRSFLLGSDG